MGVVTQTLGILCVDDHPLVRKGIAAILANETDMKLVAEAGSGQEAVNAFRQFHPDITLMDLRMPGMDGIEATKQIRQIDPEAKIIALTSYDGDQEIYRALAAGVRGYILKESVHTEIVRAIRVVHSGKRLMPPEVAERLSEHFPQVALTPREIEVLQYVAKGFGNKEIGVRLGTAAGTVKMHLQNILSKLGASDRTHAVTLAIRRGIIHIDR
ncbi:MAG: response regulator transcription factor [Acidobacteriota bacterium]|nr:response regulator transcription factor [Acidobacteriota bacterium]